MTKPPTSGWRARLRGTIWDRALLEEVPPRFRSIYTVALPIQHLLFALFALAGSTPVASALALDLGEFWRALVGVAGAIALVALLGRAEHLELYALVAAVVGFTLYTLVLRTMNPDFSGTSFGAWGFLILPSWRVLDLMRTIRRRREGARG